MIYHPRPLQDMIRSFALDNERCNVFSGMGTGKTPASIDIYDTLRMLGETQHALVLAPRLVAQMTWPGEIAKWHESFGHITIAAAIGTPAQRIAALRQRANITTMNYENLPWLVDVMGEEWFFDMVFADESTRIKGLRIAMLTSSKGKEFMRGQGSSRARALANVAHTKVRRWVNLTGSVAPNGLQDLWGQCWFVDRGQRLGLSFSAFEDRWFRSIRTPERTIIEPRSFADLQIKAAIRDICISIEAKDHFDLKAPLDKVIRVQLPRKARVMYDQMEKEMFAEIEDHGVEVFSAGAKCNKCLQIGSGAVYVDDMKNWVSVHDEKLEALASVMSEANGASVLVSYQFVPERERILKAFPQARHLKTAKDLLDFKEGRLQMGVAHPASVGHGHSWQDNCWIMCYFSTGWNLEEDEQIFERVGPTRQAQSGHDRVVTRIRIVAADTLEEDTVIPRLKSKADVVTSLKEAMKRRAKSH